MKVPYQIYGLQILSPILWVGFFFHLLDRAGILFNFNGNVSNISSLFLNMMLVVAFLIEERNILFLVY